MTPIYSNRQLEFCRQVNEMIRRKVVYSIANKTVAAMDSINSDAIQITFQDGSLLEVHPSCLMGTTIEEQHVY